MEEVNTLIIVTALNVFIIMFAILIFVIVSHMLCRLEPIANWLEYKRTDKYLKLARSNEPNSIRLVSKECEGEYGIISTLLFNKSTPNDVIEFWMTRGAWMYGLRQTSINGFPIDENLRQRILCACVKHPNANQNSLVKLAYEIINNKRNYFIEHSYPEDDLYLIYDLMNLERLPKELRIRLKDYHNWRKVYGKTNTKCDENGVIKREYLN